MPKVIAHEYSVKLHPVQFDLMQVGLASIGVDALEDTPDSVACSSFAHHQCMHTSAAMHKVGSLVRQSACYSGGA